MKKIDRRYVYVTIYHNRAEIGCYELPSETFWVFDDEEDLAEQFKAYCNEKGYSYPYKTLPKPSYSAL